MVENSSPKILYGNLLRVFWGNHNHTTLNRQGVNEGTQYRSVIFYHSNKQKTLAEQSILAQQPKWKNKIVTQVLAAKKYYRAEEYHQNYLNKNNIESCGL